MTNYKEFSVGHMKLSAIDRLHRRLGVQSDFSGCLLRNGRVVGYKTTSNPVGRLIFFIDRDAMKKPFDN